MHGEGAHVKVSESMSFTCSKDKLSCPARSTCYLCRTALREKEIKNRKEKDLEDIIRFRIESKER